jgi:PIN domain nuclease of toxin-antitoxin system
VRLLLDTHVWLWLLDENPKLKPTTLALLSDPGHERFLSPVTVWEILVLAGKGRLDLGHNPQQWIARSLQETGATEAPLTHEIARMSRMLGLHEDPADRFLVATAKVLDLHLVTADEKILRCKACQLIKA